MWTPSMQGFHFSHSKIKYTVEYFQCNVPETTVGPPTKICLWHQDYRLYTVGWELSGYLFKYAFLNNGQKYAFTKLYNYTKACCLTETGVKVLFLLVCDTVQSFWIYFSLERQSDAD